MPATSQGATAPGASIVLVGRDEAFGGGIAALLGGGRGLDFAHLPSAIEAVAAAPELDAAGLVVVDLEARRRESLVALQGLVARLHGRAPVIVVADALDDALVRWFLQIRVADFLRRPVEPRDVLKACLRALRPTAATAAPALPGEGSEILAFLPAAGGVGTTTLAIEAAMQLTRGAEARTTPEAGPPASAGTCLVDLDFAAGACADYLDLEPRLDLDEIGPYPERLDAQLLEVMLTRHESGLALIAARGRPAARSGLDPAVVLALLDLVSTRFANVVIDLPRAWEGWTDEVLLASNRVYVVTDTTVPGLRLARRMVAALGQRLPETAPRVIVNRFEPAGLFGTGLRRADVERALENRLAGVVSNNYRLVREAIDRGLPLDAVKAASNVSTDLRRILFEGAEAA